MTEPIDAILKAELTGFPDLKLAILYGSFAEARQRRDSDIDLAVAADSCKKIDPEALIDISLACSRATGREVQVRDLGRAHGLFLREVLTKGRILHLTDATVRAELIIRMLDFTEDMLPNIRLIGNAATERFIAGA
jgi:predicted nucleotidyltransferase